MYLSFFSKAQNISLLEVDTSNMIYEFFYIKNLDVYDSVYSNEIVKNRSDKRLHVYISNMLKYENTKLGYQYWHMKTF